MLMAKKAVIQKKSTAFFDYLYILTWALMPLVFLLYEERVQDAGLFPRQALIALSTLMATVVLFTKKTRTFPFLITLAAIAFFVLWHFAGYAQAFAPTEFWATFSRNALFLAYLLLTFQLLRNQLLSFDSLVKAGVLFGSFSALSLIPDLLQVVKTGNYVENIYSATGWFAHKNFAASALLMALPFLYLGTRNKNAIWKYLAIGALSLAMLEIVLLRTRGVWLGFIGGVGATVLLQLLSVQKENKQLRLIGIGSAAFLGLLAIVFVASGSAEKLLDRRNIDTRFFYWERSVQMAEEHPITGVGAGNWKINFPKYGLQGTNQSVMEGETNIIRPHNDMLWVLAEMGIPAWIALAVFQLLLLFICVKLLNHTDGEKRNYAMATIFGLVAFAVYGLGEFPIERPAAVGLLVLLAAQALRLGEEEGITKKQLFALKPAVLNTILVLLAVFGLWVANQRMAGEKQAAKAVDAYMKRNPNNMLRFGKAAQNRFFSMDIYNTPMPYFTGLGHLANQRFPQAEEEFQAALDINPYHINTLKQLGDCYKFQSRFDEALARYDEALEISPRFYMANLSKAEIYLRQKKTEEALIALNFVSPSVNYPRYKQVGVAVLLAFGQMPEPPRLPDLYAVVKNNSQDQEKLWLAYLNWKKNKAQAQL
jgi:O-antigen ligase